MNELGYAAAIGLGINPNEYQSNRLKHLEIGPHAGRLDALLWVHRRPAIAALISLDTGGRVAVVAFEEPEGAVQLPYAGLRLLHPGESVMLEVEKGPRGGVRTAVWPRDDSSRDPRTATREFEAMIVQVAHRVEQQARNDLNYLLAADKVRDTVGLTSSGSKPGPEFDWEKIFDAVVDVGGRRSALQHEGEHATPLRQARRRSKAHTFPTASA